MAVRKTASLARPLLVIRKQHFGEKQEEALLCFREKWGNFTYGTYYFYKKQRTINAKKISIRPRMVVNRGAAGSGVGVTHRMAKPPHNVHPQHSPNLWATWCSRPKDRELLAQSRVKMDP